MKTIAVLLLVVTTLVLSEGKETGSEIRVMLPSPTLMRCSADQLWQNEKPGLSRIYPVQVQLDHFDQNGCPQGIVALYDKTVPFAQIKMALDQRYAKWGTDDNDEIKVWRVEPERFAIQLATIDGNLQGSNLENERGMNQLIYLSFGVKLGK